MLASSATACGVEVVVSIACACGAVSGTPACSLGAAAVFSFVNDNHRVEVRAHSAPLPSLEQAFTDWLGQIDGASPPGARKPVYLVAAEGGGIRAAYWTGTVLSDLADAQPSFGSRLFAVSGISGGSRLVWMRGSLSP